MIVFKHIIWKNFLSTGNVYTEIDLNSAKTTLIIGKNGSGKSQFLDALCFGLFGKPYRKINKSNIVNSINEKDCVVEIEFDTNGKSYKVIRGIKPNIFEIWVDGQLLNQVSKTIDYQTYLEKSILKMNYKSFTQIDILGSAAFAPFMQLSPADRRIIIEDLLDIQVFSVMNILIKQKMQSNKEEISLTKAELSSNAEKIQYIDTTIKSLKKNDSTRLEKLKSELTELQFLHQANQSKRDSLEDELSELISTSSSNTNLKQKHSKLISLKSKVEANRSRASKEVVFYSDNNECPVCKQAIENGFKGKIIHETEDKIHAMDDGITRLNKEIGDLIDSISETDKIMETIQDLNNKIKMIDQKDVFTLNSIEKLKKSIETESNSNSLLEENEQSLKDIKSNMKILVKKQEELLDTKQYLEMSLNILKDGGIKSRIIKQYLPIVNKQINKYLKSMDFMVEFFLNETFSETIKSRYRDEFSYENFSQGEKARIDLAILFTWRYIAKLRNSVSTNILIMDEIFDNALDNLGQEDLMKILSDSDKDTHIFVISHTKEQLADKFDAVLKFEKKKDFSVLTTL